MKKLLLVMSLLFVDSTFAMQVPNDANIVNALKKNEQRSVIFNAALLLVSSVTSLVFASKYDNASWATESISGCAVAAGMGVYEAASKIALPVLGAKATFEMLNNYFTRQEMNKTAVRNGHSHREESLHTHV